MPKLECLCKSSPDASWQGLQSWNHCRISHGLSQDKGRSDNHFKAGRTWREATHFKDGMLSFGKPLHFGLRVKQLSRGFSLSLWLPRRRAIEMLETVPVQVQQRADSLTAQGGWPLAKRGTAGRAQTPEQLRKNSRPGWNAGKLPRGETGSVSISQPHFVELREYSHLPRITELPTSLYASWAATCQVNWKLEGIHAHQPPCFFHSPQLPTFFFFRLTAAPGIPF